MELRYHVRPPAVYLIAILDWFSRYVVNWALSVTLDGAFCRFCRDPHDQALADGPRDVPAGALASSPLGCCWGGVGMRTCRTRDSHKLTSFLDHETGTDATTLTASSLNTVH